MSAFAQTTVTLTGVGDAGYRNLNYSISTQKNATYITNNNASTSAFFFTVQEDLGGGLKARAFGEADWAVVKPSLANGSTTNNGVWYTGGFFNGEQYVNIESADLGDLKIGTPNSPALTAGTTAQPFGTGLGGGYSDTFGRLGSGAGTGISGYLGNATTSRIIRNERALGSSTPVVSGFKGQIEYTFQNGNGKAQASSANADGTNYASNNNGFLGLAINYNNGPLNAIAYQGQITAGANAAATAYSVSAAGTAAGQLGPNQNIKYTMFAANYNVGASTFYGGLTTTKTSNTTAAATNVYEDSKSSNFAYKYVMGQFDLMANYLVRTSNLTADSGFTPFGISRLTGIGANYNLSKTTNLYVRYEKQSNVATNGQAADGSVANVFGDVKITAVGMRVNF